MNKLAPRFVARLVAGSILAIIVGRMLDKWFHTAPWLMMILLLYVSVGSLYMLVKEGKDENF
ncbi:MAG: AtpZ/AtpI family protein [Breznakia sp.]